MIIVLFHVLMLYKMLTLLLFLIHVIIVKNKSKYFFF